MPIGNSHMFLFNSTAKATCFLSSCVICTWPRPRGFFLTTWQKSGVLVLTPRPWPMGHVLLLFYMTKAMCFLLNSTATCHTFLAVLHGNGHVFLIVLLSIQATQHEPKILFVLFSVEDPDPY